jgi:hypothetical protein
MERNSERPRLLVLGCCENTIREFEAHRWRGHKKEYEYHSDRFKDIEDDLIRLGLWPMDE